MKWTKTDGLIAATFTPLNQDGYVQKWNEMKWLQNASNFFCMFYRSLNLKLIEKYVEHLVKNGVKQVYGKKFFVACESK